MAAKKSALGLILSSYPYLRSGIVRFPLITKLFVRYGNVSKIVWKIVTYFHFQCTNGCIVQFFFPPFCSFFRKGTSAKYKEGTSCAVTFGLMHWVHKLSITINYIVPHALGVLALKRVSISRQTNPNIFLGQSGQIPYGLDPFFLECNRR